MADLYEQDKNNLEFIKARLDEVDKNIIVPKSLEASHLMKLVENGAVPKLTVHKTPVKWQRFAGVAAAFVLIGGALAYVGLGGLTASSNAPQVMSAEAANEMAMPAAAENAPRMRAFSGDQAVAALDGELYAQSYEQIRSAMQAVSEPPTVRSKVDENTMTNPDSGGADPNTGGGGQAAEVYTTNAQTENIDEADTVKTNGKSIFYLSVPQGNENTSEALNSTVKIVDAKTLELASTISLPPDSYARGIFLSGDKLAIIYDDYAFATMPRYALYEDGWQKTGEKSVEATTLSIYNVADTSNPTGERSFSQQGRYISSRLKDDTAYLVTNAGSNSAYCDKYSDIDMVPLVKDSMVSSVARAMPANDVFIPQTVGGIEYTVLSAINFAHPPQTTTKAVLGGGDTVYMSSDTIYVAGTTRDEFPAEHNTGLLKFDIAGGDIKFWAQGTVQGIIDGQFALDESDTGELRVATTRSTYKNPTAAKAEREKQISEREKRNKLRAEWTEKYEKAKEENRAEQFIAENPKPWLNSNQNRAELKEGINENPYEQIINNNLYVLDSYLNKIGEVSGLAPNESIKSVRYIGDMAYVVTFKQVDPLFAIDLKNPQNPQVLGQLKIPGFSEYLHPIDESTLLGLGYDTATTDEGDTFINGIKLSLFDVSNPKSPKEIKAIKIAGEGSYSPALSEHQAFMWYAKESIVGVPLVAYKQGELLQREVSQGAAGAWATDFNGLALFKVSAKSLEPLARLSQVGGSDGMVFVTQEAPRVERGVYIEDDIYLLSPAGISKFAISTMKKIDETLF